MGRPILSGNSCKGPSKYWIVGSERRSQEMAVSVDPMNRSVHPAYQESAPKEDGE